MHVTIDRKEKSNPEQYFWRAFWPGAHGRAHMRALRISVHMKRQNKISAIGRISPPALRWQLSKFSALYILIARIWFATCIKFKVDSTWRPNRHGHMSTHNTSTHFFALFCSPEAFQHSLRLISWLNCFNRIWLTSNWLQIGSDVYYFLDDFLNRFCRFRFQFYGYWFKLLETFLMAQMLGDFQLYPITSLLLPVEMCSYWTSGRWW